MPALAGGDRGIRVRHELGNDLRQVDPGLGEVLAEVPPADRADPDRRAGEQLGHCGREPSPPGGVPKVERSAGEGA